MSTRIGELAIILSADTGPLAGDLKKGAGMVLDFGSRTGRAMSDTAKTIADSQAKTLAALKAGLPAEIGRLGRLRDTLGGVAKHAAGNLLASGISAAAGGLRDMVTSGLELAKSAELSAMKFETMLGSVEKAAALQKDIKGFAAASPVGLADANEQAVRLLSAGVEQDQVTPTLRALTEVAGGSPQQMKDAVRAYTQVMSTGRLQGDEWNQFANLGTINFKDLAKVLKHDNGRQVDASEVKKLIEAGRVTFTDLGLAIKKATDRGGRFHGLTERYGETYAGKLDKFQDSWDAAKAGLGQGLMEGLGLKGAVDEMTKLADKAKEFGKTLGGVLRLPKTVLAEGLGAVADLTSALYGFGQKAAWWTTGNLWTHYRGEEAKAALIASEERAKFNMGRHGLDTGSAYGLGEFQDIAAASLKEQESLRERIRLVRSQAHFAPSKLQQDRLMDVVRELEPQLQSATDARANADARIQDLLKRGDPSKVTLDAKGRPYLPPKADFDPRLAELGGRLNERFADPIKAFRDGMADLAKLKDAGRLDPTVYEAATVDLRHGLEQRAGVGGGPQLAPSLEMGSEALANIVGMASQGQNKNDVPQLLEAIKKLLEEQNRTSKEIEQGVKEKPPAVEYPRK